MKTTRAVLEAICVLRQNSNFAVLLDFLEDHKLELLHQCAIAPADKVGIYQGKAQELITLLDEIEGAPSKLKNIGNT